MFKFLIIPSICLFIGCTFPEYKKYSSKYHCGDIISNIITKEKGMVIDIFFDGRRFTYTIKNESGYTYTCKDFELEIME